MHGGRAAPIALNFNDGFSRQFRMDFLLTATVKAVMPFRIQKTVTNFEKLNRYEKLLTYLNKRNPTFDQNES